MTINERATHRATTACTLDCPDSCSLEATVEDGRLVAIEAGDGNPLTQGFICAKVRRIGDHVYGEHRILEPARRVGPKGADARFETISWDEALDTVAERLRVTAEQHGGESILPLSYGGSNGLLTQDTTDARLFDRLGASRLLRTVCAAPTGAAAAGLYGKMPGVALEDYEHARLIIVWGCNPSVTGIHLVPIIKRARERGARLVVIDPRAIPLAKQADLHLQPRPGTDLALALCCHRLLFARGHADLDFLDRHARRAGALRERAEPWAPERTTDLTGVDAADIEHLVELYAHTKPAVIRCGWGVERNRNGGSAVAAILALPAVAGKFGVRGGGYTMSNSGAWSPRAASDGGDGRRRRAINMNWTGRALTELDDPPIKLLFVYNCNPLATLPHQELLRKGLERDDLFTVVFDPVRTDTAEYADLLLPATTFLEHRDLARGYGAMLLHRVRPVVEPVGEARSNPEVFQALLSRLDLDRPDESAAEDDLERVLLSGNGAGDGAGNGAIDHLDRDGVAWPSTGARPVQFVDCFPNTPDRRIDLLPDSLEQDAEGLYRYRKNPAADAELPLTLISPSTSRTVSSTFGQLDTETVRVEIHPGDARRRGIDGDPDQRVRVWNRLGEVECGARLNEDLRPGVVYLPKGLWAQRTHNGATANALAPDHLADLGGGACFNDARVEIEVIGPK